MSRVLALAFAVVTALVLQAVIPGMSKSQARASVCALNPRLCDSARRCRARMAAKGLHGRIAAQTCAAPVVRK